MKVLSASLILLLLAGCSTRPNTGYHLYNASDSGQSYIVSEFGEDGLEGPYFQTFIDRYDNRVVWIGGYRNHTETDYKFDYTIKPHKTETKKLHSITHYSEKQRRKLGYKATPSVESFKFTGESNSTSFWPLNTHNTGHISFGPTGIKFDRNFIFVGKNNDRSEDRCLDSPKINGSLKRASFDTCDIQYSDHLDKNELHATSYRTIYRDGTLSTGYYTNLHKRLALKQGEIVLGNKLQKTPAHREGIFFDYHHDGIITSSYYKKDKKEGWGLKYNAKPFYEIQPYVEKNYSTIDIHPAIDDLYDLGLSLTKKNPYLEGGASIPLTGEDQVRFKAISAALKESGYIAIKNEPALSKSEAERVLSELEVIETRKKNLRDMYAIDPGPTSRVLRIYTNLDILRDVEGLYQIPLENVSIVNYKDGKEIDRKDFAKLEPCSLDGKQYFAPSEQCQNAQIELLVDSDRFHYFVNYSPSTQTGYQMSTLPFADEAYGYLDKGLVTGAGYRKEIINRYKEVNELLLGTFSEGVQQGTGLVVSSRGIYIGEIKDGKAHGYGKEISLYDSTNVIEGDYWNGVREGEIKIVQGDASYQASYWRGKKHGLEDSFFNGDYVGTWEYKNGKIQDGQGLCIWDDKEVQECIYKDGKRIDETMTAYLTDRKHKAEQSRAARERRRAREREREREKAARIRAKKAERRRRDEARMARESNKPSIFSSVGQTDAVTDIIMGKSSMNVAGSTYQSPTAQFEQAAQKNVDSFYKSKREEAKPARKATVVQSQKTYQKPKKTTQSIKPDPQEAYRANCRRTGGTMTDRGCKPPKVTASLDGMNSFKSQSNEKSTRQPTSTAKAQSFLIRAEAMTYCIQQVKTKHWKCEGPLTKAPVWDDTLDIALDRVDCGGYLKSRRQSGWVKPEHRLKEKYAHGFIGYCGRGLKETDIDISDRFELTYNTLTARNAYKCPTTERSCDNLLKRSAGMTASFKEVRE